MSRDTRLLLVTIAVSAIVLVVLSRFRFPEQAGRDAAAPPVAAAPLERIAARATYDELGGVMARVDRAVAPFIDVVRAGVPDVPPARTAGDLIDPQVPAATFVPAVRFAAGLAVAAWKPGAQPQGLVGAERRLPLLIAIDEFRGIAVLRVGTTQGAAVPTTAALEGPAYVVIVEGTPAGASSRPVFAGSSGRISDPRWAVPLVALGSAMQAPAGGLVFSIDGALLGLTVQSGGVLAMVPATELFTEAEHLSNTGSRLLRDPGIAVQALTPQIAAATGTSSGVVVVGVTPGGPAGGLLQVGDVVTRVDADAVADPNMLLLRLARTGLDQSVALTIRRGGEERAVTITPGRARPAAAPSEPQALGLTMRGTASGVMVAAVEHGSAADEAGLVAGDVVTSVGGQDAPTPAALTRAFRQLRAGQAMLLGVARDGAPTVVAVTRR